MILILIFGLGLAYIFYFYYNVSKLPKGPTPAPFFGNMLQVTNPKAVQDDIERWKKLYGDIFTMWMFNEPIVMFTSYDTIKEALVIHGDAFPDRSGKFPEDLFQLTENGGVTFSSGENWKEQRKTALHILRDLGVGKNLMEEMIHEQLEKCIAHLKSLDEKDYVKFRWPIQVLVANVINQLVFGFSYPQNDCKRLMKYSETLSNLMTDLFEDPIATLGMPFPWVKHIPYLGYRVMGKSRETYETCIAAIKNHCDDALFNFSNDDEPRCLVQAYYQKLGSSEYLTMEQLYNVCSDFFVAGMETSTTTLRWGTLQLARHQDVQEKLRREIANVIGFDRLPSLRDKNEMPYATAFITELQRTSNVFPVNIMRRVNQDVTIAGHLIPKGTICCPQIYSALLDEKKYTNPEEFRPERFLNPEGSLNADLVSQTITFGLGKRQCAGESLARAELFLGIVTFVQKFKFFPSPQTELDLTPVKGTILFPKDQPLRIEEVDSLAYI